MTTTEPGNTPPVTPETARLEPTPTETVVPNRVATWRGFASGAALFGGGYATLSLFQGGLFQALVGSGQSELIALVVVQFLIAAGLTAIGILVGPGSVLRRIIALIVTPVGISIGLVIYYARILPGSPVRLDPFTGSLVTNAYFIVAFWFLLAFLLVRGRRPIAFLFLVITLAIAPLTYVLALNGMASAITSSIMIVLTLVVVALVVLLARLVSGRDVERVVVTGYDAR